MKSSVILPIALGTRVRYVKLGPKGCWEDEAIEKGLLLIDFDTGSPETYRMCREARWSDLAKDWALSKAKGVATRFTNETRTYFEDQGEILWVTFAHDRLYWGFVAEGVPEIYMPSNPKSTSTSRKIAGGWSDRDQLGVQLSKRSLPGSITAAASFRGTSFDLSDNDAARLIQRINGAIDPQIQRVRTAQEDLRDSLGKVVQRLDPKDFETLVDMMFLAAGWRRLGRVGSTEKTKDLDLQMPVTGETAWVQIKCATSVGVFNRYLKDNEKMGQYDRMFFVYHTGEEIRSDQENVDVLGLRKIVDMVISGGFVDWVLERAQ
ncbi:hypothetical protein [Stenotrophomonas maltophilia]|mgnify:CR=1 FL=1|nr:hypothetical protein [Stenotrophomonas maltophilia]